MIRNTYLATPTTRTTRVVGCAVLLAVLGLAPPGAAVAEDEDTSSSVYLVFDPETGEFITEDGHENALPNQTGLEDSGLPESQAGEEDVVAGPGGLSPTLLLGIAAVVVVGGGAFYFMRRRQTV